MNAEVEQQFIEARKALINGIREKMVDAGGPQEVAKRMGFTKSNLWYYLNLNNLSVNNTHMLTKISDTVVAMIKEKKLAALNDLQGAAEKLQSA